MAYGKPSHSVATIVRDYLTDIGLCEKIWVPGTLMSKMRKQITEEPVSNLRFILVLATPRIFKFSALGRY